MESKLQRVGKFAAIAVSGAALMVATVPAAASVDGPECDARWLTVSAEAHGGSLQIALATKLGTLRVRFG